MRLHYYKVKNEDWEWKAERKRKRVRKHERYSTQRFPSRSIFVQVLSLHRLFVNEYAPMTRWNISGFSYPIPAREKRNLCFRATRTCRGCESQPRVSTFLECKQSSFRVLRAHRTYQRISANNRRFSCHTYHCSSSKCSQPTAPLLVGSCNWTSWSKDAPRQASTYAHGYYTWLPYLAVIA